MAWPRQYLYGTVAADAAAALAGGMIGVTARPGGHRPDWLWLAVGPAVVWVTCVAVAGGYQPRFVGAGAGEFRRITSAGIFLIAAAAAVRLIAGAGLSRGYVFTVVLSALAVDLGARYCLRAWLHRARARGRCMRRLVAAGHAADVAALIEVLSPDPRHGLSVVALCLAGYEPTAGRARVSGVRVLGGLDDVTVAVHEARADIVVVLACPEMRGVQLRTLAWGLEKTRTSLCIAPALADLADARASILPAAGLPLVHLGRRHSANTRRAAEAIVGGLAAVLAHLGSDRLRGLTSWRAKPRREGNTQCSPSELTTEAVAAHRRPPAC